MSPQATSTGRCAICGREGIQRHHVGGQNHIAWFTMPLCPPHHGEIGALITAGKIDLTYTDDPAERLVRAQEACQIFQWMLLQAQRELNHGKANENTIRR